ncbi:hypothetical protein LIER_40084 [Lithospermum erythrorhizon]|uniref:S-protein homolog n=1 Tax=Lithospermum erythrorhizon TaxID=34254 RepID=A0AAV3QV42_LITER
MEAKQLGLILTIILLVSLRINNVIVKGDTGEPYIELTPHKSGVIVNNLLGHGTTLTIHCHSKDDDLGRHYIGDGGKYEFVFGTSFWQNTLFYCYLQYPGAPRVRFDLFNQHRDNCKRCVWNVERDGLHGHTHVNVWGREMIFWKWP